jgi:hypothetical protein
MYIISKMSGNIRRGKTRGPYNPRTKPGKGRPKCQHGRQKGRCADCGIGYCKHRRRKYRYKECK